MKRRHLNRSYEGDISCNNNTKLLALSFDRFVTSQYYGEYKLDELLVLV